MPFPDIDPILISFGPFAIRWYALAYVVGIVGGWWYVGKLNRHPSYKHPPLPPKVYDDIMVWAIGGIILGGRLGYVLFYNPSYYLSNPLEALHIWQGGMSFHGGLIGTITAIYLMCRRYKIDFLPVVDLLACAAPIGLCLGRVANFINGELFGRVTEVSWGVVFPHGGPLPRHPSQLYEAFLEGFILLILMAIIATKSNARLRPGRLSGIFLCGYALFRTLVEAFREPDIQLGLLFGGVTMGQLLCVPMLMLGIVLIMRSKSNKLA